jgi:CheY-like chemotaxis protein
MAPVNSALVSKKILIVEDEIIVLMMLEGMLQDMGFEAISSASTNEKAISLIQNQSFDAALLDMNLNGRSSSDVADALAEYHVPFAYATGNSTHDTRDGFRDHPVLRKPFSDQEFNRVILALTQGGLVNTNDTLNS